MLAGCITVAAVVLLVTAADRFEPGGLTSASMQIEPSTQIHRSVEDFIAAVIGLFP
jgi:hypothetical protein